MSSPAVELTTDQAWFLAEELRAGSFPWKLAITAPFYDPAEREAFNRRCRAELVEAGIIDGNDAIHPAVASSIRTICHPQHWLEWLTVVDENQILRGVLARGADPTAFVVALRYAQMLTLTPMHVTYTQAVVPIITTGLPEQPPARFDEFVMPMETGATIDKRIARGADITTTLTGLGIPESSAQAMELARGGEWVNVEITAHEAVNGAHRNTDVGVSVINTDIGRILVAPEDDRPRAEASSVFSPADPFAVAVAIRDLTARLPSGPWFPDENLTL